jgi:type IV pilus assembly protein PilV
MSTAMIARPLISRPLPRPRRQQKGIALIEALVAVVLLGVGLLGIIGLQARSYSALADTSMRAEATMAADKLLGVMAADQANLSAYAVAMGSTPGSRLAPWYDDTRTQIPGAGIKVEVAQVPNTTRTRVTITIAWARKANTAANQHVITSYIATAT